MKIIILGGNLSNLGAEAMVKTVVEEIGNRFKDADFFLFSTSDFNELGRKKLCKNLSILPWGISIGLRTFRFVDFILPKGLRGGGAVTYICRPTDWPAPLNISSEAAAAFLNARFSSDPIPAMLLSSRSACSAIAAIIWNCEVRLLRLQV